MVVNRHEWSSDDDSYGNSLCGLLPGNLAKRLFNWARSFAVIGFLFSHITKMHVDQTDV
ncbi:hypothetical protein [Neobacillus niacini]|uniref:hypothetical protein n=1 Tax=Neobacillus niacini TaxID=86668 RepID=UPI0021CB4B9F|nr:hypothetical protein [Neobacillus niacini]MCM3763910.1 hypothetical protein [Neobacillus niacini]